MICIWISSSSYPVSYPFFHYRSSEVSMLHVNNYPLIMVYINNTLDLHVYKQIYKHTVIHLYPKPVLVLSPLSQSFPNIAEAPNRRRRAGWNRSAASDSPGSRWRWPPRRGGARWRCRRAWWAARGSGPRRTPSPAGPRRERRAAFAWCSGWRWRWSWAKGGVIRLSLKFTSQFLLQFPLQQMYIYIYICMYICIYKIK